MIVLKLLKEIGKDFVKSFAKIINEFIDWLKFVLFIALYFVVPVIVPTVILHYIWFDKADIFLLASGVVILELLIVLIVLSIKDFIKYIKRKWNEVK